MSIFSFPGLGKLVSSFAFQRPAESSVDNKQRQLSNNTSNNIVQLGASEAQANLHPDCLLENDLFYPDQKNISQQSSSSKRNAAKRQSMLVGSVTNNSVSNDQQTKCHSMLWTRASPLDLSSSFPVSARPTPEQCLPPANISPNRKKPAAGENIHWVNGVGRAPFPPTDADFRRIMSELDISRITDRIIVTGLPWSHRSEKGSHRNNIQDMARFFGARYRKKYMIFNLTDTINYDTTIFNNQVYHHKWSSVLPTNMKYLFDFARAAFAWLDLDSQHVAVVHCNNGKSRSGIAVACLFRYLSIFESTEAALEHFIQHRSQNDTGWLSVTILRYAQYFDEIMNMNGQVPNSTALSLNKLIVNTIPNFDGIGTCQPGLEIYQQGKLLFYNTGTSYAMPPSQVDQAEPPTNIICDDADSSNRTQNSAMSPTVENNLNTYTYPAYNNDLIDNGIYMDDFNIIFRGTTSRLDDHTEIDAQSVTSMSTLALQGDITIRLFHRDITRDSCSNQTILTFAVNTGFVTAGLTRLTAEDMELPSRELISKAAANGVSLNKLSNSRFSPEFSVDLYFADASQMHPALLSYHQYLDRSYSKCLAKLSQFHYVISDENLVNVLEEQGYIRILARYALQRASNDLHVATELLKTDISKSIVCTDITHELVRHGRAKLDSFRRRKSRRNRVLSNTLSGPPNILPNTGTPTSDVQHNISPHRNLFDTASSEAGAASLPYSTKSNSSVTHIRHKSMSSSSPSSVNSSPQKYNTRRARTETVDTDLDSLAGDACVNPEKLSLVEMMAGLQPSFRNASPVPVYIHRFDPNDASLPLTSEEGIPHGLIKSQLVTTLESNTQLDKTLALSTLSIAQKSPTSTNTILSPPPPPPRPPYLTPTLALHLDTLNTQASSTIIDSSPSISTTQLPSISTLSNSGPPPPPPPLVAGYTGGPPPPPPITGFAGGPPPPPPPPGAMFSANNVNENLPLPSNEPARPKLRSKLHWNEISDHDLSVQENTVWADKYEEPSQTIDFDVKQFEELFCEGAPLSKQQQLAKKPIATSSQSTTKAILDTKRANNVAIGLARFNRRLDFPQIRVALQTLDTTALNLDDLQSLPSLLPLEDEAKQLNLYINPPGRKEKGDPAKLSTGERFMVEMLSEPNIAYYISTFSYLLSFDADMTSIISTLTDIKNACDHLRDNKHLKTLLRTVLALGNMANYEYGRGAGANGLARSKQTKALGFRLDGLVKLKDFKSADGKVSLLHYLVSMISDGMPEITNLPDEFTVLRSLRHIQTKDVLSQLKVLGNGLSAIQAQKPTKCNAVFNKAVVEFVDRALGLLKSAQQLAEEMASSFSATAQYFGENPESSDSYSNVSVRQPEDLFNYLCTFFQSYQEASSDNQRRKDEERKRKERIEREITRRSQKQTDESSKKIVDDRANNLNGHGVDKSVLEQGRGKLKSVSASANSINSTAPSATELTTTFQLQSSTSSITPSEIASRPSMEQIPDHYLLAVQGEMLLGSVSSRERRPETDDGASMTGRKALKKSLLQPDNDTCTECGHLLDMCTCEW